MRATLGKRGSSIAAKVNSSTTSKSNTRSTASEANAVENGTAGTSREVVNRTLATVA